MASHPLRKTLECGYNTTGWWGCIVVGETVRQAAITDERPEARVRGSAALGCLMLDGEGGARSFSESRDRRGHRLDLHGHVVLHDHADLHDRDRDRVHAQQQLKQLMAMLMLQTTDAHKHKQAMS